MKVLRVLLDPARSSGLNGEICFMFDDGSRAGLLLRDQVAIPTDGEGAVIRVELSHETWAKLLSGKVTPEQAVAGGDMVVQGSLDELLEMMGAFDLWYDEP